MADVAAVTSFYGRWARLYDLIARRTPGIGSIRARTADALALGPGDTVVEMGVGTGANLPYLRERVGPAGRVVGIDLTPGVLARTRRTVERAGWSNVHAIRGNAARPPLDVRADALLATFVVGMLDDPAAAVTAWIDGLEPGGRVALLDATRSGAPATAPADALFRAFVALSAPPTTQLRYDEAPAAVLDRRVAAAREALADRTQILSDEPHAFGFVRLTVGQVP